MEARTDLPVVDHVMVVRDHARHGGGAEQPDLEVAHLLALVNELARDGDVHVVGLAEGFAACGDEEKVRMDQGSHIVRRSAHQRAGLGRDDGPNLLDDHAL